MQSAYIGKLMEIVEKDSRVLHILADSGTGYDELFRMNFPEQIYNLGISEEHMVAVGAGMATCGKIPFLYTAGAFLVYRAIEFIRDDICFQNLNVKIVGMGSGLAWSSLGPTHHTTEDIAILNSIPNLVVLSPATPNQVSACVDYAYKHTGPVYIRIGMNNEREFYENNSSLDKKGFDLLREGNDIAVFSTGSVLEEVYDAVELLSKQGISVALYNIVIIKALSADDIEQVVKGKRIIVTVEEHNIRGGIGSILSDIFISKGINIPILKIGLNDKFAVGYGKIKDVRKANGLDSHSICDTIKISLNENDKML